MGEWFELWQEIKRVFDLELADEEYCSCATPRHLIDLICSKLPMETATACPSQRAFYLLRGKLVDHFGVPWRTIKPSLRLSSIIPAWNQDDAGIRLRNAVGAKVWPGMPLSGCYARVLGASVGGFFLAMLLHESPPPWQSFHLWHILPTLFVLMGAFLVVFGHGPSMAPLQWRKATLRHLVPYVETSDRFAWTREKVAQAIKLIILEQFGLPEQAYREDARLVEDFRLDT